MTYSSRNFLISGGDGSDERTPRVSKRLSSAMMSLHTSTHSSQMNTVGPAISLRTSFWSLLQKEQRKTSESPLFFTHAPLHPRASASRPLSDDFVDDTVFFRLLRGHDVVPLGIFLDPLGRLVRVEHENLVQSLAHAQNLARRDVDIGRLSAQARHERLMDHDARVGQ